MNACASARVALPLAGVADDGLDAFAVGVFAEVCVNAELAASVITAADLRIRCKNIAPPEWVTKLISVAVPRSRMQIDPL
jgi:hypothetical protein